MFDFQKSVETSQKLAQDAATQFVAATSTFTKSVVEANTKLAATFAEQITEAYKSFPVMPSFEAFTKPKKTSKGE